MADQVADQLKVTLDDDQIYSMDALMSMLIRSATLAMLKDFIGVVIAVA